MRLLLLFPHPCLENNGTLCALIEELTERGHSIECAAPPQLTPLRQHQRFTHTVLSPSFFLFQRSAQRKALSHWIRNGWKAPSNIDPAYFHFENYDGILAVDPQSLAALNRAKALPKAVAYLSFEQMFGNEIRNTERTLYNFHRAKAKHVGLVLVQDNDRASSLCHELGFGDEIIQQVPVATTKQEETRLKLDLPKEKSHVLYCGNLETWTGIESIHEMIDLWPENVQLVIQSWRETTSLPAHIRNHPKITVLDSPLSPKELLALARKCDVGLASYHPTFENWATGRNLKTIGRSSGKIATYAQAGLPILCSQQPSLKKDFDHYGLGLMYSSAIESGDALGNLLQNHARFSKGSERYYREVLDPTLSLGKFTDRWERLVSCSNQAEDAEHPADSVQAALPGRLSRQS